jgi:hypothetical protein
VGVLKVPCGELCQAQREGEGPNRPTPDSQWGLPTPSRPRAALAHGALRLRRHFPEVGILSSLRPDGNQGRTNILGGGHGESAAHSASQRSISCIAETPSIPWGEWAIRLQRREQPVGSIQYCGELSWESAAKHHFPECRRGEWDDRSIQRGLRGR